MAEAADFVVVGCIVLANALCLIVLSKFVTDCWRVGMNVVLSQLYWICGLGHPTDLEPEVQAEVENVAARRRLQIFAAVNKILVLSLCGQTIYLAVTYALAPKGMQLGVSPFLFNVAGLALLSMVATLPRVFMGGRTSVAVHVLLMGTLCFVAIDSPWGDSETTDQVYMLVSFVAAGLCLRIRVIVLTNIVMEACAYHVHWQAFREGEVEARTQLILKHLGFFLIRLAVMRTAEIMLEITARSEVMTRQGECQMSAVFALLNTCCDAVIDLNDEKRIRSDSPKLAALLMHGSERSLQGSALADFVPEGEDRDQLHKLLADASALPSMQTLRVRDAISNLVAVELLHVPYKTVGGRLHHLVGVRELGENTRAVRDSISGGASLNSVPGTVLAGPSTPGAGAHLEQLGTSRTLSARRSSSSSSSSRSSSTNSSDNGSEYTNGPVMEMSLFVRVGDEELPIMWMGSRLKALISTQGKDVKDFCALFEDEGQALYTWIVTGVQDRLLSGKTGGDMRMYGDVDLSLPGAFARRRLWVRFAEPLVEADGHTIRPIGLGLGPVPSFLGSDSLSNATSASTKEPVMAL